LIPHVGIPALGNNECLPVLDAGNASAVTASLKLSICLGEIFAVHTRRAEE